MNKDTFLEITKSIKIGNESDYIDRLYDSVIEISHYEDKMGYYMAIKEYIEKLGCRIETMHISFNHDTIFIRHTRQTNKLNSGEFFDEYTGNLKNDIKIFNIAIYIWILCIISYIALYYVDL